MAGSSNFPTALDDNTSLIDVTDGVSTLTANQHNNPKEAIKAIEAKVGVYSTAVPTSLDYRLGNPTGGHNHNGASGQGGPIVPLTTRLMTRMEKIGSAATGATNITMPVVIPRTLVVESVAGVLRRGPSGATAAFDINIGPTSIWTASQGLRLIFPPGATVSFGGAPNLVTYPSGAVITLDSDTVGTSAPGEDLGILFIFRDNNA